LYNVVSGSSALAAYASNVPTAIPYEPLAVYSYSARGNPVDSFYDPTLTKSLIIASNIDG